MASQQTTVLITGATRGIGKKLFSTYLLRPNHTVVGGVRNTKTSDAAALHELPRGEGSKAVVIQIDSASETDAKAAISSLTSSEHGINRLDIVIANAGISNYFGKAEVTPVEEMITHYRINTVGPLLLFQATALLLEASPHPKFVVISSGAGSLTGVENLPVENTAYGASKAAVNFVMRRIHYENPKLVAFPINPGWLQTDLGNHAAKGAKMAAAPVSVQEGVDGIIKQIDDATRDKTSGKFMTYTGDQLPW